MDLIIPNAVVYILNFNIYLFVSAPAFKRQMNTIIQMKLCVCVWGSAMKYDWAEAKLFF